MWSFCSEGETLVSGFRKNIVALKMKCWIPGSWDNTVRFWQVTPTEMKESRRALNLKVRENVWSAIWRLVSTRWQSCPQTSWEIEWQPLPMIKRWRIHNSKKCKSQGFQNQVVMLDRREGPRKCSFYKVHSKPVLAVKLSERQVFYLENPLLHHVLLQILDAISTW